MASLPEGPVLEICNGHKREQSQDSGAYIDWNSEDSASPNGNLDGSAKGDFVTVVAVESGGGVNGPQDSPFVTVLEISDKDRKPENEESANAVEEVVEEVLVYRLPGERLGFGLKFEGGTNTAENVKRLFIQSSAPDSPASRAECSWGSLAEGDEIIKIDGHEVKNMTRLDCVRCLKESSVVIKLYVRHANQSEKTSVFHSDKAQINSNQFSTSPLVISAEVKKKVPPPPPIPPRKIPRKTLLPKDEATVVVPPEEFCDVQQITTMKTRVSDDYPPHTKIHSKSSFFVLGKDQKQDLHDACKRIAKRGGIELKHIPPEPEVYLDLLSQEDSKNNCESESDDTSSTISTVMGLTMSPATGSSISDLRSNTSSICDSTTPSTPTSIPSTPVLDTSKLLIPCQSSENNDFLFTKMIGDKALESIAHDDRISIFSDEISPLQPPLSFQDAPLSYGNEEIRANLTEAMAMENMAVPSKSFPEENFEEGELPKYTKRILAKVPGSGKKSSLIPRLAKSIGLLSPPKPVPRKESSAIENGKTRSGKKRPPPPPPPRCDRPRCPQPDSEPKALKSSISYLKKKKAKNDHKNSKPGRKSKLSNQTEKTVENDFLANEEKADTESREDASSGPDESPSVDLETQEVQDTTLSWTVPDLRTTKREDGGDQFVEKDLPEIGPEIDSSAEPSIIQEASSLQQSSPEFGIDSVLGRKSFFSFQWGSAKHLETIGEDEEDGSAADFSAGTAGEEKHAGPAHEKTDSAIAESAITEEDTPGPKSEFGKREDDLRDGKNVDCGEAKPEEVIPAELLRGSSAEDAEEREDVSPTHHREKIKESHESCKDDGLANCSDEKLSEDVETELKSTNGVLKETMIPIRTAATGFPPPPIFNRLPPDGHEFPQTYQEEDSETSGKTKQDDAEAFQEDPTELPPLPASDPPTFQMYSFGIDRSPDIPPIRKTFPVCVLEDSVVLRPSRSSFWRQDEKSEKSVRDKIAMFSSVSDSPISPANAYCSGKLSKYKSSDDVFHDEDVDYARGKGLPPGKHFSRSVVSIDKICGFSGTGRNACRKSVSSESSGTPRSLDYANRTQSSMDLTSSSSSAYSSSCSPDSSLSSTTSSYLGYSSTLPRKSSRNEGIKGDANHKSAGVTRTTSFSIHGRSQSLLDINRSSSKSRFRTEAGVDDEQKQTSLSLLMEQRRKNLSKLRGLVIPEKLSETPKTLPIIDLPEIKSRDMLLTSKLLTACKEECRNSQPKWETPTVPFNSPFSLGSPVWKAPDKSPNVPKYSPAFKRKSITVYGSASPTVKKDFPNETENKENGLSQRLKPPAKPPRSIQTQPYDDFIGTKPSDAPKASSRPKTKYSPEIRRRYSTEDPLRAPEIYSAARKSTLLEKFRSSSDAGRLEEDSDNDSAVSSSRSSTSHGFSPPSSPLLDNRGQSADESSYGTCLTSRVHVDLKSPLIRSLSSDSPASVASNASTLTSGSHANCNSNGDFARDCNGKRVLKPQSVEAINRKNVLTSAKYSRGFNSKSGSPQIQRKLINALEKGSDFCDSIGDDKESVLSVGKSCSVDSHQIGDADQRTGSNFSFKSEAIAYKLATDSGRMNGKAMDVKIAFMNDMQDTVDHPVWDDKRKLAKTESSPYPYGSFAASISHRRTSVPFAATHWKRPDEWSGDNEGKSENFKISRVSSGCGNISSGSPRSRASSADTVHEQDAINGAYQKANSRESTATDLKRHGAPDSCSAGSDDPVADKVIDSFSKLHSAVSNSKDRDVLSKEAKDLLTASNVSVNDIRKAFEKVEVALSGGARGMMKAVAANPVQGGVNGNHVRVSSLDSTNSEDSCLFGPGPVYGSTSNLHREQFGSITSLASSTSLISPQELQILIDEANQTLEESGGYSGGSMCVTHDVLVVILHRDTSGGSIGITLAGGADYESKEITVHKVLVGSPADRDGRIQKGDRILSINGRSMKGVTHRESLAILKSPRPEVVLVVSRPKSDSSCDPINNDENSVASSTKSNNQSRPPRILEGTMLNDSDKSNGEEVPRGPPVTLTLLKDGAGLGFSLEGGKDSPVGDKPLVVKKIFTGGAAEKCGCLKVGDEILNVNGIDVTLMTRIEAWKMMKRIPDGKVSITVRHMVENSSSP